MSVLQLRSSVFLLCLLQSGYANHLATTESPGLAGGWWTYDPENSYLYWMGTPQDARRSYPRVWDGVSGYNEFEILIPDPGQYFPHDGKLLNMTLYSEGYSIWMLKILILRRMNQIGDSVTYEVRGSTGWIEGQFEYTTGWTVFNDFAYLQPAEGDVIGIRVNSSYGLPYMNQTYACYGSNSQTAMQSDSYLGSGAIFTATVGDNCREYPYVAAFVPNDICLNRTLVYEINMAYYISTVRQKIPPYSSICWIFTLQEEGPSEPEVIVTLTPYIRVSGTWSDGGDCTGGGTMETRDGESGTGLGTICSDTDLDFYGSVFSIGRSLLVTVTADYTEEEVYFDVYAGKKDDVPDGYYDQLEEFDLEWRQILRYAGYGVAGLVPLVVVIVSVALKIKAGKAVSARGAVGQHQRVAYTRTGPAQPSGVVRLGPLRGQLPGNRLHPFPTNLGSQGQNDTMQGASQGPAGQPIPGAMTGAYEQPPAQPGMTLYRSALQPLRQYGSTGYQPMTSGRALANGEQPSTNAPPPESPPPSYGDIFSVSNAVSAHSPNRTSAWTDAIPPPAVYIPK